MAFMRRSQRLLAALSVLITFLATVRPLPHASAFPTSPPPTYSGSAQDSAGLIVGAGVNRIMFTKPTVDLRGGSQWFVPVSGSLGRVAVSPDGTTVAFVTLDDTSCFGTGCSRTISALDIATGVARTVYGGLVTDGPISWSPQSDRVVVTVAESADYRNPNADIAIVTVPRSGTGGLQTLAASRPMHDERAADWSSTGQIVYLRAETANAGVGGGTQYDFVVASPTSTTARVIASDRYYSMEPVWSPDAARIAWADGIDGWFDMPSTGGGARHIYANKTLGGSRPTWWPSGNGLLIATAGSDDAWLVPLDRRQPVRGVPNTRQFASSLSWSPRAQAPSKLPANATPTPMPRGYALVTERGKTDVRGDFQVSMGAGFCDPAIIPPGTTAEVWRLRCPEQPPRVVAAATVTYSYSDIEQPQLETMLIATADGRVRGGVGWPWLGDMQGKPLAQPIVGVAGRPGGRGYWLVAGDGGIFSFGDATFFGSTGAIRLNQPIVGMAATPSGNGYWFVARDGGIFSFGDATFFGSTGAIRLNQPIVGMAATPSGNGYWMVAADGGIFTFGDAAFLGSGAGRPGRAVGIAAPASGLGYWIAYDNGSIAAFGDAVDFGGHRASDGERIVAVAGCSRSCG